MENGVVLKFRKIVQKSPTCLGLNLSFVLNFMCVRVCTRNACPCFFKSKVLRAGLPMPALADCRQLADSSDHYNDTDTFFSFTSSKLNTQRRHSDNVGASRKEKKQKKKKLHEGGGSSSSRSSSNAVNEKGGGSRSNMNGGSRSGGGRSGQLPKSCGAALANAASQAHAKKHNPCPSHQLSCSAVKVFKTKNSFDLVLLMLMTFDCVAIVSITVLYHMWMAGPFESSSSVRGRLVHCARVSGERLPRSGHVQSVHFIFTGKWCAHGYS